MARERAREWKDAGDFFEWSHATLRQPLRIFHAEFGDSDAPPLVLVHGFPTSSIDWFDVVNELGGERRVCVLDFPGFGFSDKPKGGPYTIERDADLLVHYLLHVAGVDSAPVVAHDRGDSVALAFAQRCASGAAAFALEHLVLSNGNVFLPLSSLTPFQRMVIDPGTAPEVLANVTPELLAAGLGQTMFTPRRELEDPAIRALADTFAVGEGISVLHDTIQYLHERSERETDWLEALSRSAVPTTVVWGLYDTVSPLRVAAYVWNRFLAAKPGTNELWLLPAADHYLQHDQAPEFAQVLTTVLAGRSPQDPGPLSDAAGAPILVDRSRAEMPSGRDVLAEGVTSEAFGG